MPLVCWSWIASDATFNTVENYLSNCFYCQWKWKFMQPFPNNNKFKNTISSEGNGNSLVKWPVTSITVSFNFDLISFVFLHQIKFLRKHGEEYMLYNFSNSLYFISKLPTLIKSSEESYTILLGYHLPCMRLQKNCLAFRWPILFVVVVVEICIFF